MSDTTTSADTTFDVEVSLGSESHFFAGLSGDVRRGGIFVSTYKSVPLGAPVRVTASLPTGEIAADGTVRWVRGANVGAPPGIGVELDGLTAEQLRAIEDFCSDRPPLYVDLGDRASLF